MRVTRAIIDLERLKNNFFEIKKNCQKSKICAAIKADAYGHGAVKIAKYLESIGCDYFGIATTIEAKELISSNIKTPLILLSLPTLDEIEFIVLNKIEPVVNTIELIKEFEESSKKLEIITKLHLKVDTGMGRIGCKPSEAKELAIYISNSPYLSLHGLCTHFSTSEDKNQDYTNKQYNIFLDVIIKLKKIQIKPKLIHAANSGAILMNKKTTFNMVRTGINLYGYPPVVNKLKTMNLKPIMELKSSVIALKKVEKGVDISYGRTYTTTSESYIATLPIGYADGYFRSMSNRGEVLINGKRYPIVGNICMDQLMVKVDSSVKLYDEVTVMGYANNAPSAEEIAKIAGTISYEVLTNIQRVRRYYINS